MASCCMPGRSSLVLFTRTTKLDRGAHGARCAWAMAIHHAVGISRQRNSGYRPSRVNIMAQGLSTPDPSLSHTHLYISWGRATTTHYTHHQVSLMVSCNTTLVPFLGLCIGPACEAGLSAGMWREHVSPQIRKKERKGLCQAVTFSITCLKTNIGSLHDLPCLKPACPCRSWLSIFSLILSSRMLANTLPGTDSSVIPCQLLQFVRSPFFGRGMIISFFQTEGAFYLSISRCTVFLAPVLMLLKTSEF